MQRFNKMTFLAIITLTILVGCDIKEKLNEILTFYYTQETSFTIPSSAIIDIPLDIQTPDISSSGQQEFENNNTSANLVETVYLSELDLTISNPSTRTFSFLKSIEIYIKTNEDNEILLAEKQNINSSPGSSISLETTDENLKTYVSSDSYSLRFEVVTRETTNSKTDILANMKFVVKAREL